MCKHSLQRLLVRHRAQLRATIAKSTTICSIGTGVPSNTTASPSAFTTSTPSSKTTALPADQQLYRQQQHLQH